jgi:hypothetical protein
VPTLAGAIQSLILFSVLLGVVFLVQVYGVLPGPVFDVIFVGWVLFVVDSVLTFVRRTVAFYLAFILAVLALASSLPQSAHYAFIQAGELLPSATFILGSLAQVLLVLLVPYFVIRQRRSAR